MLSSNPSDDSVLASYPDILVTVQVYRPFQKTKVAVSFVSSGCFGFGFVFTSRCYTEHVYFCSFEQ